MRDHELELREALEFFNSFIPDWANPDVPCPEGLDPTFYGTGSREHDLRVRERVAKARALLEKGGPRVE